MLFSCVSDETAYGRLWTMMGEDSGRALGVERLGETEAFDILN